jgi:Transglutaminase-like superfamily
MKRSVVEQLPPQNHPKRYLRSLFRLETLLVTLLASTVAQAQAPQTPPNKTPRQIPLPRPASTAKPPAPAVPSAKPPATPSPTPPSVAPTRWTAAQPDAMVDLALARAKAGGSDAFAALLIAASLDERATQGKVRPGLRLLGQSASPLADDARWLSALLSPAFVGPTWSGSHAIAYDVSPDATGLVRSFAILGPFPDKGSGLLEKEGPEAPGQSFVDPNSKYSWGVYDVSWRRTLPTSASPRGVPLDLYIHPRTETCTYLASKVSFSAIAKTTTPLLMHVASTGKVRVLWDGADVAISEDTHQRMMLDRLALKIDVTPGPHLVAIKVCSGALHDEGRVRLRFTTADHKPTTVSSSSNLSGIQLPPPPAQPKPKANGDKPALVLPKGVSRIPTFLEQNLDVGANPKPDVALRAAIVRTLGGADDTRSPRAPGLLEVVVRDKSTTPDTLALIGWISPFGAERTERLNLAFEQAKTAGDNDTLAFAQRRLFESSLTARMPDWALARVREAPLSSAIDLEARLLKLAGRSRMGAQGARRSDREQLQAMTTELRGRAPIAIWAELMDASHGDARSLLAASKRLADLRADSRSSYYVAAHRILGGAELEKAAADVLAHQRSADDLVSIATMLLDAGRNTWAREVFFLATRLSPNKPAAFHGLAAARKAVLADELRQGKTPTESPDLIKEALLRAQALEPTDAARKAEIAMRTRLGGEPAAMPDEKAIVQPNVFLARAKASPANKSDVFDRQLHWLRFVTYHPDRRVSQLMHYAREIVIEPRTEAELTEPDVPAEGDRTELLLARVHRKDGSIGLPEEQAGGGRGVYIRWPKLQTGDVVEVAVRSWTAGPVGRRGDAPYYFIDISGSTDTRPIMYNEVVVESPKASPLAVDVLNGKADRSETKTDGDRIVQSFIWDKPTNVPDEPLAPYIMESVPLVVGSTFAGWADFRTWYKSAVEGFSKPDDRVKELAAELTKGKKTRDEKIRAVFNYVADSIRYVNYVSGESWLPNRPQISLARKQGDCDDKAMLLITLLEAIGIQATEVLIQTRYAGQSALLRSEKVAVPLFDHGIAYLPAKDGAPAMWLDATTPQSRIGPLPAMDARTLAFFIDNGPPKMIETPLSSPDDHGVEADWKLVLQASGEGKLTANEQHVGDAAFELRTNLVEADARRQWVEQYLTGKWVAGVEVAPDIGFDGDMPNGAAKLRYQAQSRNIARREGQELVVPLGDTVTFTSQLAPLPKRTLPVVLPAYLAPRRDARTLTITAPSGYDFAELPPGGAENGGEFGKATLEIRPGEPGSVVVKRTVVFDLSTIPLDKYQKWRTWLQHVDALTHRTIRLVPQKPDTKVFDDPTHL